MRLSWVASHLARGGSARPKFRVTLAAASVDSGANAKARRAVLERETDAPELAVDGLALGQPWVASVQAFNAAGSSGVSQPCTFVCVGPPSFVTAAPYSAARHSSLHHATSEPHHERSSCVITWRPPVSGGVSSVTGYRVELHYAHKADPSTQPLRVVSRADDRSTPQFHAVLGGLEWGTMYTVAVYATSRCVGAPPSTPVSRWAVVPSCAVVSSCASPVAVAPQLRPERPVTHHLHAWRAVFVLARRGS